jgi:uncharacterized repeat protein (TIGR03803 family)
LVQATNRDFYGTTKGGGAHAVGTVFRITPSGKLTTLHSFDFNKNFQDGNGVLPYAGLVQGTDGDGTPLRPAQEQARGQSHVPCEVQGRRKVKVQDED